MQGTNDSLLFGMLGFVIFLILAWVWMIASAFLQVLLSKQKAAYPGLILPVLSACVSLILPAAVAMDSTFPGDLPSAILSLLIPLCIANIPTLVYLLIYVGFRRKIKSDSLSKDKESLNELEKMRILDIQ